MRLSIIHAEMFLFLSIANPPLEVRNQSIDLSSSSASALSPNRVLVKRVNLLRTPPLKINLAGLDDIPNFYTGSDNPDIYYDN